MPELLRELSTMETKFSCWNWLTERLTETTNGEPLFCHLRASKQAVRSTHSPMERIRPVSSAMAGFYFDLWLVEGAQLAAA